ncbi:MAG: serine/threonine-protein kinase [Acidobacteriota bacterium]
MNVDSWATVNRLMDEALDLAPGDRERWLDRLAPQYGNVLPRLRNLLACPAAAPASAFLNTIPKVDPATETGPDDVGGDGSAPGCVGPYRVLRKLADGGMGSVWLAERSDGLVKRQVAVKLPRGAWRRAGLADRMARERDILATLNHPNIARLYDAGVTSGGEPFLALEYVPGRPLDDYAEAGRLTVGARLQLFLQVTRAVAHAHARLIIHRDLKPSNILVTDAGDVKLLDFGIAKLLEEGSPDSALTEAAGAPLTPDYASPEQVAGEPLSIASDVYSLGVVLYQLLAGVRPYKLRRDSRGALEEAILQAVPRRPSDAAADPASRRTLRGDLDTIVLKALRKNPAERYDTVNAFAEDIERYLHGRAVRAQPDRWWYRCAKFVGRNRIAVCAAAAVFATALTGAGLVLWQSQVALTEKAHAEEVRDFLTTLFRDTSPYDGGRALSAGDWLKHVAGRVNSGLADRPELRVDLLNLVGSSLLWLQDTAAAEGVLTQAVAEATRRLGPTHPATLRARVLMTPVYRYRGRTRELRLELDRLLPLLRESPADLAEPLAIALKNRAHLEMDDGRYAAAERVAQEGLDVALARLGERHPETVAAFLMIALTYQTSRSPDLALQAAERALRIALGAYADAPRHPRVIEARQLYGQALANAGRPTEGIEQLTVAVDDAAAVFGSSSRMVGFFSEALAAVQLESGDIRAAIAGSRRSLAIVGQHSTPESFRYASVLHLRGAALLSARRSGEALPDLARAARTLRQAIDPPHARAPDFEADQALALARLGQYDDAQQIIGRILPRDPRPDDPLVARLRYVLGVGKRLQGEHAGALRLQQQALAAIGDGTGAALHRANVLKEAGLNLQELNRPAEAATLLEQALTLIQRWQSQPTPDRGDVLIGLGRARMAAGRLTEARSLLQEADRFWRGFDAGNRSAGEAARWLRHCQDLLAAR